MKTNQQAPLPVSRDAEGRVLLNSVFHTVQGEGPFAGQVAIFLRLSGCNLQCPFCDTEYSKVIYDGKPEFIRRYLDVVYPDIKLVVITGGEPFRQNITPLVNELLNHQRRVQIETNGTLFPGADFPWSKVTVVCSPKTGKIHPQTAKLVAAYKYVLSHDSVGGDGLPNQALGHTLGAASKVARPPVGWEGPVYLQPMDARDNDENARNIQAVVKSVMDARGKYIMGVQMHKLSGLP